MGKRIGKVISFIMRHKLGMPLLVTFLSLVTLGLMIVPQYRNRLKLNSNLSEMTEYLENYQNQMKKDPETPVIYTVLLDNSASMMDNFQNMKRQPLESIMVLQALIAENERIAVFPLMGNTGKIEILGSDDYRQGQEKIKSIPLFEQEGNEDTQTWIRDAQTYIEETRAALPEALVRVLVITDKRLVEMSQLNELRKEYFVTVYDSGINPYLSAQSLETDSLAPFSTEERGKMQEGTAEEENVSGRIRWLGFMDANDLIRTIFEDAGFGTYYRLYEADYSQLDSFLYLSEDTDRIAVITRTEGDYLESISPFAKIQGTLIGNGCLYKCTTTEDFNSLRLNLAKDGEAYILYPSNAGGVILDFQDNDREINKIYVALIIMIPVVWLIYGVGKWLKRFFELQKKREKKIFISYRRTGGATLAHSIADRLRREKYTPFLDTESLRGEKFDSKLVQEIEQSACMVLVLPPGGLDRCSNNQDWVGMEIRWALYFSIPIVPVLIEGFQWPDKLPDDLEELRTYNAVMFDDKNYFQESMDRVVNYVRSVLYGKTAEPEPDTRPWFRRFLDALTLKDMYEDLEEEYEDDDPDDDRPWLRRFLDALYIKDLDKDLESKYVDDEPEDKDDEK